MTPIVQIFFKLIYDEPYNENKVIDYIKQHKKSLVKPLPSVEGGNAFMLLLKLINQFKNYNKSVHKQEIQKAIFAMRRAVFLLVQYAPESLDNRDFKQQNPLIFPAEWADFDLIDLMLKQGARPDTLDYQGMTPLHAIIKTHSQSCFDLMLSVNPDLTVKTADGQTLLHTASKFGNSYAVGYLTKREPQLKNETDFHDEIPLEQAKRVLTNADYWHMINNAMKKQLPQSHWQQIVDKLSF
ncbi:ankyrin repeat domain-containing protein [Moraxella equi]|nr:ankyrin repeat domain-containing protein [Moraxella equi]STZ02281.1 Ankyrin repeats (3 copies) [Moraxella equi]